jgi:hypothetical protein
MESSSWLQKLHNALFFIPILCKDESSLQKIVPFLFLVARNYIHCCKWTETKPVLNIFKIKVKQKEKIEKINALVENKM